eukprot:m.13124 g.13124  ORF g.13124 m.13124 type:complete len:369 (+) comp4112_c0_seq1:45-1151(+)
MPPPPPPPSLPKPPVFNEFKGEKLAASVTLTNLINEKQPEMDAIIPTRPKTPPPMGPEKFYDAKFVIITPSQMYNTLQFGSRLLVVDLRSKQDFDKLHVRSSVNWDCLEKQDLADVEKGAPRIYHRRIFKVVLYDDGNETSSERIQAAKDILSEDRRCEFEISVLQGGLSVFMSLYPFLVKGTDSFSDSEYPSEILEGKLYLGSWATASKRHVLDDLSITHIVNATQTCDSPFQDELNYIQCPIDDAIGENISEYFDKSLEFIRAAFADEKRVLVHCKMGMSRSSTFVLLYLMEERKMTLKKAMDFVVQQRPYINPNPAFLFQLMHREEHLFGEPTIRFPDTSSPMTMATPYEWKQDDGSWVERVVIR